MTLWSTVRIIWWQCHWLQHFWILTEGTKQLCYLCVILADAHCRPPNPYIYKMLRLRRRRPLCLILSNIDTHHIIWYQNSVKQLCWKAYCKTTALEIVISINWKSIFSVWTQQHWLSTFGNPRQIIIMAYHS